MIVKTKTYKKSNAVFASVLQYMMREGEYDEHFLVTKFVNTKKLDPDGIAKEYIYNETNYRKHKRSNSVLLQMDILSFHPDDYDLLKDNRILKKITRTWIRKRAPYAMATAVVHRGSKNKNTHVHIAISGINYKTGESSRLSKEVYMQCKLDIESYQKKHFPFLKKSEIRHDKKSQELGKAVIKDVEYKMQQKRGVVSSKIKALELLADAYLKASSEQQFYTLLKYAGIELYKQRGKYTGFKINNRKHRFRKLGYLPHSLQLLNNKEINTTKRLEELETIKNRQKDLSKDWEQ